MKSMQASVPMLLLMALTCFAQGAQETSSVASVYVTQYLGLHEQAEDLMKNSEQSPVLMREEKIFATIKLLHKLEESVQEENLSRLKKAKTADKDLLLVQNGCQSLDLALSAFDSYLDTSDREFLCIARDAEVMARNIRRVMTGSAKN